MTDDRGEVIRTAHRHLARRDDVQYRITEPVEPDPRFVPTGTNAELTPDDLDLGDPHEARRLRFERLQAALPSHKSSEPPAIPWNAIDQRVAEAIAAQHEYFMEELMPRIIARLQEEATIEIAAAKKVVEAQITELGKRNEKLAADVRLLEAKLDMAIKAVELDRAVTKDLKADIRSEVAHVRIQAERIDGALAYIRGAS
jgi:hypothetical protein